ncbi:Tigger transposable element-derived protein 6 [Araneus ventricosus]|uniref:Tigger transposable element-derived protein 6 n=1 Tax=Araneus ventricosus TaxID=182803 RepID=A0A4Y2UJ84_ARAVE|nr:Tigger transposable element-derived protein 6 [Araneus ventricosus]
MKVRNSTYPKDEEYVRKLFDQCHDQIFPVSGLMLQQKAEDFAKEIDSNIQFKAGNGWLENFKKMHNIVFRKLCGENASADESFYEEWLSELPSLLKDYKSDDVFNADKTGLFFQCLPNKTAAFKGEEYHGGKQSKFRVTVLLTSSYDRTIQKAKVLC